MSTERSSRAFSPDGFSPESGALAGRHRWVIACALLAASLAGMTCVSPAQDDIIESLGPEKSGIPEGPFHRYGQPCLACHGGYGPGSPLFEFGGTVFATPQDDIPVSAVTVTVTDANGVVKTAVSNCAGNFYSPAADDHLVFPLRAEVSCELPLPEGADPMTTPKQIRRSVMQTRIDRDGSCASCHDGNPSPSSPGRISCGPAQPATPFIVPVPCQGGPH